MIRFLSNFIMRISLPICLLALLIFVFNNHPATSFAQEPEGVQWDQAIHIPSPEDSGSWFPDLAVDSQQRVHVVWNETKSVKGKGQTERVFYSMWDGHQWSPFNDIVSPQNDIIRQAIAVDANDTLHMVFGWLQMFYKQASVDQALSAAAWTSPRLVNSRTGTYLKDIAVYQDTLHIVYDDTSTAGEDSNCLLCADIFYRQSPDLGTTWSAPIALFPTNGGSARAQLEIDKAGILHVAWDEGWDRLSGYEDKKKYGIYIRSSDGGNTWSSPTMVTYPNSTNVQLTAGSNGQGGVMLVWRTISLDYPGIFYMWSTDEGAAWAPPKTLPNIVARAGNSPFDKYDMATDSAGHIHLLVVGHLPTRLNNPPGLYHLEWDGKSWSMPMPVYEGNWYPEYPQLIIHGGNQLHATWFIREKPVEATKPDQIWYAHGQSPAPAETPIPRPSPTLALTPTVAPTVMSTPTPKPPTPTPTLDANLAHVVIPQGATEAIYTDMDEIRLLTVSLIPAVLIIIVVLVSVRFLRR